MNNIYLKIAKIFLFRSQNLLNISATLITLCLIFFCNTAAKAQCDHTFRMIDSYGDGWNGATVDVVVGGVTVLDDVSPADAGYSGTQSIDNLTFDADDGDAILLGDWESGGGIRTAQRMAGPLAIRGRERDEVLRPR